MIVENECNDSPVCTASTKVFKAIQPYKQNQTWSVMSSKSILFIFLPVNPLMTIKLSSYIQ